MQKQFFEVIFQKSEVCKKRKEKNIYQENQSQDVFYNSTSLRRALTLLEMI